MPRATLTVAVEEIPGEPLRFRVESWTQAREPHLVDLLAYEGRGECSCINWSVAHGPKIKAGLPGRHLCRHVTAARAYFLDDLLHTMALNHAACGERTRPA